MFDRGYTQTIATKFFNSGNNRACNAMQTRGARQTIVYKSDEYLIPKRTFYVRPANHQTIGGISQDITGNNNA